MLQDLIHPRSRIDYYWYRFFLTQSYNQINTSSDPKQQSRISTLHLSGAVPAFASPGASCHRLTLTLNNQKTTGLRLKEQIKKETIRIASLQIGFDVNSHFFLTHPKISMKAPSDVMSILLNNSFLSKRQGIDFAGSQPLISSDKVRIQNPIGFLQHIK